MVSYKLKYLESDRGSKSVSNVDSALQSLLNDLKECANDSDYDDNYLTPTPYAMERTKSLLSESAILIQSEMPLGTLFPDGNGGIRIEWIRPNRELRLMTLAEKGGRDYLYHEEGEEYKAEFVVTPQLLAHWLKWLDCKDGNGE